MPAQDLTSFPESAWRRTPSLSRVEWVRRQAGPVVWRRGSPNPAVLSAPQHPGPKRASSPRASPMLADPAPLPSKGSRAQGLGPAFSFAAGAASHWACGCADRGLMRRCGGKRPERPGRAGVLAPAQAGGCLGPSGLRATSPAASRCQARAPGPASEGRGLRTPVPAAPGSPRPAPSLWRAPEPGTDAAQ